MKAIQLTQGRKALVDDEDFALLNQWKWCVNSCNYPMRVEIKNGKRITITIHRFIMKVPKGMQVDHINRDRLDNRRANLRVCTQSQNCTSRPSWRNNKTGYRGVTKTGNMFTATIKENGKKKYLGTFSTPELAAQAFDLYSRTLHGEYAVLNFK